MGESDRLLFCNVSYLKYYNDTLDAKPPKHGGSYPEEKKTGGECKPREGVYAQPAPPVRPGVLRNWKGHCQACGHSRSLKHKYHKNLHHLNRNGAS